MMKDDGHVLHFTNPKGNVEKINQSLRILQHTVQASLTANTFAISGNCEEKRTCV